MLRHLHSMRLGDRSRPITSEFYAKTCQLKKLMGHLASVYCVCFDQTGQYIFTGSDDHLIKVWSARDGRLLKTLRGHAAEITDMSVNYDNRLLASGSVDRVILIWDLRTAKLLECLTAHSAMITSVRFSPYNRFGNSRYLVSTSNDGSVVFWSYHKDELKFKKVRKYRERTRPGGRIICSSCSTGGSILACGSSDNCIHVYGFQPGADPYWMAELDFHKKPVDSIQFSNLGMDFISGSQDGFAAIWSYKDNRWVPRVLDMATQLDQTIPDIPQSSKPSVVVVQWSRDDRYVLTSTTEYSIKVWEARTGKLVYILNEHERDVYMIESHPTDPRIIISSSHDGTMVIWDLWRAKVIKKFKNVVESQFDGSNVASFFDMKISPDGTMIAATDSHGYLTLYGMGGDDLYKRVPEQMFFNTDYGRLIRDVRNFPLDEATHIAPHLLAANLVDMNGDPHPPEYQSLVPNYKDGRHVIPPPSVSLIKNIAENIENHSKYEDEQFLKELRAPVKKKKNKESIKRLEIVTKTKRKTRNSTKTAQSMIPQRSRRKRIKRPNYAELDAGEDTDVSIRDSDDETIIGSDVTISDTIIYSDDDTIIDTDDDTIVSSEATDYYDFG